MVFKNIHRASAILLILFIAVHLGVHLSALWGIDIHDKALRLAQKAYRSVIGESILTAAIIVQIFTGLQRLRLKSVTGWAKAQAISGIYLLFFLLLHTSAALYTHHIFDLKTDFYWAAGSLHFSPIKYGFAIYYGAAVIAFFTHLGAAIHYVAPKPLSHTAKFVPVAGAICGGLIVFTFSGAFYPITINDRVAEYYETNFGFLGVDRSKKKSAPNHERRP